MRLRRRILVRLRPADVLALVVPVVVMTVARVTYTLSVAVVVVALAVAVMLVVRFVLRGVAVAVVPVLPVTVVAGAGVWGCGDPPAARALGGSDSGAGCRSRGRWSRAGTRRRRLRRSHRSRRASAAGRPGARERRRDNRSDLAGSGRWRRDRGLLVGPVEKARRGQNEADRGQYGEQADHGCGYARKTTPHNWFHRRASA